MRLPSPQEPSKDSRVGSLRNINNNNIIDSEEDEDVADECEVEDNPETV
jgi:hypothetical protein